MGRHTHLKDTRYKKATIKKAVVQVEVEEDIFGVNAQQFGKTKRDKIDPRLAVLKNFQFEN
jgi:hypothetical protein